MIIKKELIGWPLDIHYKDGQEALINLLLHGGKQKQKAIEECVKENPELLFEEDLSLEESKEFLEKGVLSEVEKYKKTKTTLNL